MASGQLSETKYSILDLATVVRNKTPADTFKNSLEVAKLAEQLGYTRYWFAEHHNMQSVASSAPPVLIGYIAGGTKTIRVGSGGVMLPNHSPLIVAEQFGTLATLYPGRIDLGLGRAPGTDQLTAYAIRGENMHAANNFLNDVERLQVLFSEENKNGKVRANPGEGLDIPIWILGSSTDSAYLAAAKGLPYAFASHFAPTHFLEAINIYRNNFQPSAKLKTPYVLACINGVAADTDEEASYLSTSLKQLFMGIVTGKRQLLPPPVNNMENVWSIQEKMAVEQMLTYLFTGGLKTIKKELQQFISLTQVDEIIISSHIYDHQARMRSYQIFAEAVKGSK